MGSWDVTEGGGQRVSRVLRCFELHKAWEALFSIKVWLTDWRRASFISDSRLKFITEGWCIRRCEATLSSHICCHMRKITIFQKCAWFGFQLLFWYVTPTCLVAFEKYLGAWDFKAPFVLKPGFGAGLTHVAPSTTQDIIQHWWRGWKTWRRCRKGAA